MKHKFSSMGRVAIALVLALSLCLVMAAPVAANVENVTVGNVPQTIDRAAEYTIDFNTNEILSFAGSATIIITFPIGTVVPEVTAGYDDYVTVNDTVCADDGVTAVTSTRVVTITVPKDIPAGPVEVVIDALAGIENPGTVLDTWTLTVRTSAEIEDVTSAPYSTIPIVPPEIIDVVGTAYQNSNDTIVITFSELVDPDNVWSAAFPATSILCGTTELNLTGADFSPADTEDTLTLTITLDETVAHLVRGTDNLKVTPAAGEIANEAGDSHVEAVQKTGSVSGDTVGPAVALTYDLDRPVLENETLVITAIFTEDMAATPAITIVDAGSVTLVAAVNMETTSATEWYYDFTVPAGSDGEATVTISGVDLAGNANQLATNNTFVIDNTDPVVAVTDIIGSTTGVDTISITFFEDVVATGDWDAGEVTSIKLKKTDADDVTVDRTDATYDYASNVLTITLAETGANTANKDYLLNGYTVTFDPATGAIKDLAGNSLADAAIDGTTAVTGDLEAPTITRIVGVGTTGIKIVFSELAVAADGTWSANEFSIESPAGAPLNINHAAFTNDTAATTVLIITLDTTDDDAVLVEGEVVCVTPATDAVVDLAGNPLASVEVNSGEAAGWLEVWVDDDDGSAAWDVWVAYPTNFETITEGITAVAIGGTVNVAAGTYAERPAINKSLTLSGPNAAISPNTGTRVTEAIIDADGVSPAVDITADDVTVEGFTIMSSHVSIHVVHSILVDGGATGAIISCNVVVNDIDDEASQIALSGVSDCEVSDNLLTESFIWLAGVSTSIITGNHISGVDAAGCITIQTTSIDILIQGNSLSNGAAGISIPDTGSADPLLVEGLQILGNDITANLESAGEGIAIGANIVWGDGNAINNNNITGNTKGISNWMSTTAVDATDNWWGDANGPSGEGSGEGDSVSTYVDYSPWLDAAYPYGKSITTTGHFTIDLVAGWNLISLPLIPTNSNIDAVLADLKAEGSVIEVRAFLWEAGVPGQQFWLPATSTLDLMEDGWGYWIHMSEADALVVTGSEQPDAGGMQPSYNVYEGWNLIGFKSLAENRTVLDYLGPAIAGSWATSSPYGLIAAGTVEIMYGYDATSGVYELVLVAGAEYPETLVPGKGYWVAVNEDGTIYP